jgi:outer membrane protein assembly factor BamD
MRKFFLVLPLALLLLSCGGRRTEIDAPVSDLDEPDRVLYERAIRDLDKNKFTVSRLTLQTLINTYQDSEYLERAKYALAESFYRENSTSALNQAEGQFKDFITFFPISELADDAQLKVAMTHFLQREKSDRDNTQALLAEAEFKAMIQSYPDSNLLDEAKQRLRGIQEVLADGVYKIGGFYHLKKSYPAAIDRYKEIIMKYPDYTRVPEALFFLADSLEKSDNPTEAGIYFTRLVSEHPLSERVKDAKQRLVALNMPVPDPNPVALARAQAMTREDRSILGKMFGMFSRRPPGSSETGAASSPDQPAGTEREGGAGAGDGGLRGGVTAGGSGGNGNGGNNGTGTFSVDPKVVQPGEKPR